MPRDTRLSDSTECLLLIDPPADGAWNMAVDEVLLDEVTRSGQPVLRFYQWRKPTLSLGYFQKSADRTLHPSSSTADIVRRLSGGGAILHDRELTYSLILPQSHELARDTQQLYDRVHQAIVEQLRSHLSELTQQWQTVLCCEHSLLSASKEPFLCFLRRSKGDILLQEAESPGRPTNHKVVGSAQRRRRGTVLQHGSILLDQSRLAPELPGFNDITKKRLTIDDLSSALRLPFASNAQLALTEGKLSEQLLAQAQQLEQAKYRSETWTDRR